MHAIDVKQLTKTYSNGIHALKGINLEVKQGDFFALLGPNGAGKSTTIGILCSLVNKTSGSIRVFGHDMDKDPAEAKRLIGVVPQEMNFSMFDKLFHILINQAGYYGIPKSIATHRAEIYLKEMNLWDMRDQPAFKLSGGMKRRLMIARALMSDPKLLVLDEPTAGVDIELRHLLWNFLTKRNQEGTTIILTTHYLEEAEHLCKHVAIIDHGEIIEHANMKSLINRLHRQTLILDLEAPLSNTAQLNDFTYKQLDPLTLEVEVARGQSLNTLFDVLSKQTIHVTSLRNKTNRLEELFIDLIAENKKQAKSS